VNGSLLDGSVYDRKSQGQQLLDRLFIFVRDGFPEFLDVGAEKGPVSFVDGVTTQASSPLADCRLMMGHFYLLSGSGMIRHLCFKVNKGKDLEI